MKAHFDFGTGMSNVLYNLQDSFIAKVSRFNTCDNTQFRKIFL